MKFIIILLCLPLSLLSQNKWSEPVQLSAVGSFPDILYLKPAITYSVNGTIHAFWVKNIPSDKNRIEINYPAINWL